MPLLSFSIDLSNSTEVKSIINDIVGDNRERKEEYLETFHRQFTDIEKKLYSHCIHNDIPLESLFLVKSIGDELWYLYDLNNADNKKNLNAINQLLSFLIEFNSKIAYFLFISERDVDFETEERSNPEIWNSVRHQRVMLRIKSYADIIDDYIDPAVKRFEAVRDSILHDMSMKLRMQGVEHQEINSLILPCFPSIAERLNLGYTEVQGRKIASKYIRTDVIGKDVDLFFRCSKYSTTCLLTIGEKLFQYAAYDNDESFITILGNHHQRHYYFKQAIPKRKLYSIYVLPPMYPDFYHGYYDDFKKDGCCKARQLLIRRGYLRRRLIANTFNKVFKGYLTHPPYHIKNRSLWIDRLKELIARLFDKKG